MNAQPEEPESWADAPATAVGVARPRLKWIAVAAALAVGLAVLIWVRQSSRSSVPASAAEQSLPLVSVAVPGLKAITSTVSFTGTIAARYDMPLGTEGEGGRIVVVLVEAGDRVTRNQLLARLDGSVLGPQVQRLAAALEEARAQAALSAAEFKRAQDIAAADAFSKEEFERRRAAALTDEAKVKVAAAQLAEMQARLAKTEIRAPQDGTVLTRNAEVGQMATPGQPLFRLAGKGEIEMRGQIAERDLALIALDQPAHVYLTGIAAPFEGRVRLLSATIDPATRLGEIRVALAPNGALRPGAFARGEIVVNQLQRPVLPQTAVLSDERGTYVYLVNGGNEVERRAVQVATTTPDGIAIASGLRGDERVVMTAGGFLREGERVAVAMPAGHPTPSR